MFYRTVIFCYVGVTEFIEYHDRAPWNLNYIAKFVTRLYSQQSFLIMMSNAGCKCHKKFDCIALQNKRANQTP